MVETNDLHPRTLKRVRDPPAAAEHLAHQRVHVVVHRAFDGIALQDERLAATPGGAPHAAAVLAPQTGVRHMVHQPDEDRRRLDEESQAEREPLDRMVLQIASPGPLQIESAVQIKCLEAAEICLRLMKIVQHGEISVAQRRAIEA
jgi:hypothetical protein